MNKFFKIMLLGIVILSSIYSTSAENLIYSSTDDFIDNITSGKVDIVSGGKDI